MPAVILLFLKNRFAFVVSSNFFQQTSSVYITHIFKVQCDLCFHFNAQIIILNIQKMGTYGESLAALRDYVTGGAEPNYKAPLGEVRLDMTHSVIGKWNNCGMLFHLPHQLL